MYENSTKYHNYALRRAENNKQCSLPLLWKRTTSMQLGMCKLWSKICTMIRIKSKRCEDCLRMSCEDGCECDCHS